VTQLLRTRDSLVAALDGLRDEHDGLGSVVLVPTMGALHEGHRALLRAARGYGGPMVVSIFVNPLQFGPGEDLDRYPRTLESDLAMCAEEGAAAVFVPSAAEMYPHGEPSVTVDPGPMGAVLEGEFRPGFFAGVLTVVAKLLGLIRPAVAVFGEKDAQQLAMVRRMVRDLDLGVRIAAVPTVRDPDGLAISSRNRYLSEEERTTALALSRALDAACRAAAAGPGQFSTAAAGPGQFSTAAAGPGQFSTAAAGPGQFSTAAAGPGQFSTAAAGPGQSSTADTSAASPGHVLAAARRVLDGTPGLVVDYLALVDPDTFAAASSPGTGPWTAVLVVAARVGATRLIDNVRIDLPGGA
jgi:pantoate--beta-alanine ligase